MIGLTEQADRLSRSPTRSDAARFRRRVVFFHHLVGPSGASPSYPVASCEAAISDDQAWSRVGIG
jgi:hypothetical protein